MIREYADRTCACALFMVASHLGLCWSANGQSSGGNVRYRDLELDLRGHVSQTYDSNIGRTDGDEESDWITAIGLRLDGTKDLTEINTINLGIGLEYRKYWKNPEYDSDRNNLIVTPNTELELLIQAGNFDFRVYDQFSMLSDPGDQRFFDTDTGENISNVVLYNRINNRFGADGIWTINPYWDATAGISRIDVIPLDSEFDDLERYSYTGSVGLIHNVASNLIVNGVLSGSIDRWKTNYQPDSTSWSLGGGANWRATDVIETDVFIAWTNRSFDSNGNNGDSTSNSEGLTGNVAVSHAINPILEHSIRYFRSIDLGTVANEVTTQGAEYRVDYAGFERSDIYFSVFWYNGEESGSIDPEDYDRWAFRSGLAYPLSKQLEFSAYFEHSFRDSNVEGREFSRNLVTVTLEYDL